jgi:hypothetical protein
MRFSAMSDAPEEIDVSWFLPTDGRRLGATKGGRAVDHDI